MNKKKFTLIEIMFVVGILVILIGIGGSAANKALRKQADMQIKSELKMIQSALAIYKNRYEFYPPMTDTEIITCGEYLRLIEGIQHDSGRYYDAYEEPYKYTIEPTGQMKVYSSNQD